MSRQKKTGTGKYKYFTVTFKGPDGKRKVVRTKTNKNIDEVVRQAKENAFSVAAEKVAMPTYYDWVKSFIEQKSRRKKLAVSYEALLKLLAKNYIKDTCGGVLLSEISLNHLEKVMDLAISNSCADSTRQQIRILLSSSLEAAVRNKLITENPAKYLEKIKMPIKSYEAIPRHIMQMLLTATRETDAYKHYTILLECYLKTGCRRGEILGLERKHFDAEKQEVRIVQELKQDGKRLYLAPPKTNKSNRPIPLSAKLTKKIAEILTNPDRKIWTSPNGTKHDFIFLNRDGLPYMPHSVSHFVRMLRDKLADKMEEENNFKDAEVMRNIHLHSTRHYCISQLVANPKIPLPRVRDYAGHADISFTNRYIGRSCDPQIGQYTEEIID